MPAKSQQIAATSRTREATGSAPPRPQQGGAAPSTDTGAKGKRQAEERETAREPRGARTRPPGEDGWLRRATRERTALGAPARTLGSARPRGRGERVKRRRPVGGKGGRRKTGRAEGARRWDRRPDGERCRKTEAGAAARGDRPEAPRSARQARAARPSLGDLRTRGPGHRGRTSHPAASRRRDSGEGGKTPIPILCSNK